MSERREKWKAVTELEKPQLDAFRHAKNAVSGTPETPKKRDLRKLDSKDVTNTVRHSPRSVTKSAKMKVKATLRSNWTPEEDEILKEFVKKHGKAWHLVQQLQLLDRNTASCRTRWKFVLDPSINKKPFSKLEDAMLFRLIADRGRCWKEFAALFEGRTPTQLRGRAQLLERRVSKTTSGGSDGGLFLPEKITGNSSSGLGKSEVGEESSKSMEEDVEPVGKGRTVKLSCLRDTCMDLDTVGAQEDLRNICLKLNEDGHSDADSENQVSEKEMQLMEFGKKIAERGKAAMNVVLESSKSDEYIQNELQIVVSSKMEDPKNCSPLNDVTAKIWSNDEVAKARKKWEQEAVENAVEKVVEKAVADSEAKWHAKLTAASQAWDCEKRLLMESVDELKRKVMSFGKDAGKMKIDC